MKKKAVQSGAQGLWVKDFLIMSFHAAGFRLVRLFASRARAHKKPGRYQKTFRSVC